MSETTTIFTMAQFAMIGLFAVVVIFGIIFGMRLKRRRLNAEAEVQANRDAAIDEDAEENAPKLDASSPAARVAEPDRPVAAAPSATQPERRIAPADVPVAKPEPTAPAPQPASAPAPAASAPLAGDITQLKGLGPKLATTLAQLGITRVDQIAAMSPAQLDDLDAQLGTFRGRPARDRWAEQAALLTAGDKAAYEAEFGKLG